MPNCSRLHSELSLSSAQLDSCWVCRSLWSNANAMTVDVDDDDVVDDDDDHYDDDLEFSASVVAIGKQKVSLWPAALEILWQYVKTLM